jgi:ABC-type Fe3+/spermidine/putrescine transport system ATPase subunit
MEYQLELIDVGKKYKDFLAVDGVNLQIKKGEIVSFLGASGCGKTTTLRMIAGLIEPTKGTIKIEGKTMNGIPPYKRDISMVFQNYALFPHLTVYENIVYGLKTRKIKDKKILMEKAREMMDLVQLHGVENRLPKELSGGQQQRVSLARAMIVEPKVMLFDEPLSNLDAKLREKTRVEIRNLLKRMNVTAIYVTHDQEEALTISDRIAVMNKGIIEQITEPMELYKAPATRFIADFVGHANLFEGKVTAKQGDMVEFTSHTGKKLKIQVKEEALQRGDEAAFIIRPENVEISGNPIQKPANVFKGKVTAKIFMGSTMRLLIDLGEKKELEADLHAKEIFECEPGQDIYVYLPENELVLVRA